MNYAPLLRTAARWKISRDLALEVLRRDLCCIYCGRPFEGLSGQRAGLPSWEHIVNDESIVNATNIALCCIACNSSKGTRTLAMWFDSAYCKGRNITSNSIAEVAASALSPAGPFELGVVDVDLASRQPDPYVSEAKDDRLLEGDE